MGNPIRQRFLGLHRGLATLDPRVILPLAAAGMAIPLAVATAQPPQPYTVVETGQGFARLQDAVLAIGDGQGTIRIAPGRRQDCAVQERGTIAFVAQVPGQSVFEKQLCEGKAVLVLRGRGARVDGIVFAGLFNDVGNGAGIRLDRGNLAVSQSWFRGSDEGILTSNDPRSAITIDKSTFTHLGRCDRGLACAHSIYVGDYGSLTVTRSRFEAGDGGHYVKSRAARVTVTDSAFDDAKGRDTNYMIDLPAGASGRISGNWFLQGLSKDNPTALIAIAAESHDHSANGLVIADNMARFVPGFTGPTALVADWSGDRLAIGNNTLAEGIRRFQRRF